PEPHRSVTFPWPGLTPQRSTRGATRARDSNTQLNARDNHRASQARPKTIRDRPRRGRRPLSLRDSHNRIPREKNRRGWSEAEASEVLRPPAFEVIDGRLSALNLYLIDGRLSGLSQRLGRCDLPVALGFAYRSVPDSLSLVPDPIPPYPPSPLREEKKPSYMSIVSDARGFRHFQGFVTQLLRRGLRGEVRGL